MAQTPTGTPADGDTPDQDTATPPAGTGRVWGEAAAPGCWSGGKTLAAVAVATVLGAGGALVIHAAGGGSSGGGGPEFGGRGWGGHDDTGSTTLHSESVVDDGYGSFHTEFAQTGVVTRLSDTEITAHSADGFTRTYAISPRTKSAPGLEAGATATIAAIPGYGGAPTATTISLPG